LIKLIIFETKTLLFGYVKIMRANLTKHVRFWKLSGSLSISILIPVETSKFIEVCIYISSYLCLFTVYLYFCQPVCLTAHQSDCILSFFTSSVCLSAVLLICLSIYISLIISVCPFVSRYVSVFVNLSVNQFVCTFISKCFFLSIY
jgi:hypothetical protein